MTRKTLMLGLLIVCVLSLRPQAQSPARMDEMVKYFSDDNRKFMGSVLVARDAEVLFSRGYGFANLEWNVSNTPSTKFRLGSISKQFTAAAILLLEERGKLSTADPVKRHLPDAPEAWDKITIHHLLSHTAGIPNFTSFPDYMSTKTLPSRPDKTLARFRDRPLDFEPGGRMSYSNSGYILLGLLVEMVSGQSYEGFLQQHIFDPLGMKDSGSDSFAAIIPGRASGYAPSRGPLGGPPVNADYIDMTIPIGGGSLYSTTEDLLRWTRALFGGKLLSAASLAKMTTPILNDYAYGLVVRTVGGRQVIEHGGGIEGFNTMLKHFPGSKITVAALANLNGPQAGLIAERLATLAHGEAVVLPTERKEITLAPELLKIYTGTYDVRPGVQVVVALEGDRLHITVPQLGKATMYAESETRFFLKDRDVQVEFFRDSKGDVTHLMHGGMKAVRK